MKINNLNKYCDTFFKKYGSDCCPVMDRRCLSVAVSRFLDSGKEEDAFDVYFAFAEIFKASGNGCGENTKYLLERICGYERNTDVPVENRRDYSCPVFIFAAGLAVYVQSSRYRTCFKQITPAGSNTGGEFLYRWGVTSLFYDSGYPFESEFEHIKTQTKEVHADGFTKKLSPEDYPLAFLFLLCGELQDNGREGFREAGKTENSAYAAGVVFSKDEWNIKYIFNEKDSIIAREQVDAKRAKLQFYDLERLLVRTEISYEIRDNNKIPATCMPAGFFKNIQKIAMQIHTCYLKDKRGDIQAKTWDALTLEYKLSNIAQAKSYTEKLNKYGYFYDDKDLPYPTVTRFSAQQLESLARDEHKRWLKEKIGMGWKPGFPKDRKEREEKRLNPCLIPYSGLSENEKEKDRDVIRHLIENLNAAGFKVYKK